MIRRAAWFVGLFALTTPSTVFAQAEPIPTTTYALTNARVVVGPGEVIERGTIIVRGGRIAEVGPNVRAPAGVVPIDLSGRTVYPGLIDAASSAGLPGFGGGFGRGGGGGGDSGPSASPTQPGVVASDMLTLTTADLAELHGAGFTTLGLAFDGGLLPGKTSVVSLKRGPSASLVLKAPVAQQVAFGRNRGGYPGTLMGALAYIEQSWEDTKYDMRVQEAFQQDPASAPRPVYDPDHAALEPAVTGTIPVWFEASAKRDFRRVVDLAERLGVTDYAIVGAQEGWLALDLLTEIGRPLVVSLDFPNPRQVTGRAWENHVAPLEGEDVAAEEADSAAALQVRSNPAALIGAGLSVALSAKGLDLADFRAHVGAAIEAGLSPDDALRAVTVTPATLLGLSGAIGTVEPGKFANLVVTDGDLFDENTEVLHVFVEGQRFDYTEPAAPGGGR